MDVDDVETVVVSHLHYDHAGTLDTFGKARFHIQEAEMAYATGPCMCEDAMRKPFTADHVCSLVKKVYSVGVQFHDGDGEIAPGVTVHKSAGHSKGLQSVRVANRERARGVVCLRRGPPLREPRSPQAVLDHRRRRGNAAHLYAARKSSPAVARAWSRATIRWC